MKRSKPIARLLFASPYVYVSVFLCTVLLIACACMSAALRASYTDYAHDPEAFACLPFDGYAFVSTAQYLEEDPEFEGYCSGEGLVSNADVIAKCAFPGTREINYLAVRSQLRVDTVFKGHGIAAGQSIMVWEPVALERRDAAALDDELLQGMQTTDGAPAGQAAASAVGADGKVPLLSASGAYEYGGVPLKESGEYLVFLRVQENVQGEQEYLLCDSPYACLPLDPHAQAHIGTGLAASLAAAQEHGFVAQDQESLDEYRRERAKLLALLEDMQGDV